MKNLKYLVLSLMIFIGVMSFDCTNDEDPLLFNSSIVGTWDIEKYPGEYILFKSNNTFVMNDTISGGYNIQSEDDTEVTYSIDILDENGDSYDSEGGLMEFSDIHYGVSIVVKGLPTHEEETLKIIYRKH